MGFRFQAWQGDAVQAKQGLGRVTLKICCLSHSVQFTKRRSFDPLTRPGGNMDFDVESLSTRICQLDGLPRILRAIVFLERRKLALRNRLYPSSNNDKALKFRFLDLPIEIQVLIIREYIQGWPLVGQTPDLIKALRPQPGTYQQALAVFYSSRTVTISANNEHRVLAMPKSVLRKAVSVDICYGYVHLL